MRGFFAFYIFVFPVPYYSFNNFMTEKGVPACAFVILRICNHYSCRFSASHVLGQRNMWRYTRERCLQTYWFGTHSKLAQLKLSQLHALT